MSDHHLDDHLDDDALSAALDGEATPAEQAHLRGCATCQAGVARFGQLATLVGAAVAQPPDEVRDRQISAAVRSAPVSLDARRRRPAAPALAAIAAVVLAVLIAVPVLLTRNNDDGLTTAAERDRVAAETFASDGAQSGAASLAAPSTLDLGPIGDEAALRTALAGVLAAKDSSMEMRSGPVTAPAAADSAGDDAAGSVESATNCETAARAELEDTAAALDLVASALWQDRAASVFVFGNADAAVLNVVVVAVDDCTLLTALEVPAG